MTQAMPTVLAVASGGGHWVQMRRMRSAWAGCPTIYLTTEPGYRAEVIAEPVPPGTPAPQFFVVPDANLWHKLNLARQVLAIAWLMLRLRPDVVLSTGAAPGYFALRLGRMIGARTIWIDSIANADELSLSGRKIGRHADLWLTQWEHLGNTPGGPQFRGAVL